MANTGHDWGSFAFVQEDGGDWDANPLLDDASDTSGIITVDTKSSILIGMLIYVDSGTVHDNGVTISVLRTWDDTTYETPPGTGGSQIGDPFKFTVTPVSGTSVLVVFSLDPKDYNLFKIAVLNEANASMDVSVKIKTADIPAT